MGEIAKFPPVAGDLAVPETLWETRSLARRILADHSKKPLISSHILGFSR